MTTAELEPVLSTQLLVAQANCSWSGLSFGYKGDFYFSPLAALVQGSLTPFAALWVSFCTSGQKVGRGRSFLLPCQNGSGSKEGCPAAHTMGS